MSNTCHYHMLLVSYNSNTTCVTSGVETDYPCIEPKMITLVYLFNVAKCVTIVFVVGLFPYSFFEVRFLITSLISSIYSYHFCIPVPTGTIFHYNIKYDCLATHAHDISINYILYICPWSTLSSTSARACTCSGEWGSAACTHGNPSKLRITLITPITNKSQWYAVPFFILKDKSTCYYIDQQYIFFSSSFKIDETQLIYFLFLVF